MKVVNKAKATEKKNATPKKSDAIAKKTETPKSEKAPEEVKKSSSTIDQILNPTAEGRIRHLQTFNILAEKKEKIDTKLDELTHYNASNDGTRSNMVFSADNGYNFTISNPLTINQILEFVENELFRLQEKTEKEILDFQI